MLTASGLIYRHSPGAKPIWPGLEFDTHDARFVLLSGPSGCGKSTLLRLMCGLLPGLRGGRLDGRLAILGRPAAPKPDGRVGLLFQNAEAMLHSPRVGDELLARAAAGDNSRSAERGLSRGWLGDVAEQLGLGGLLDRRIVELSGGEQQRVALAAVLAARPEAILLDEPTSNLDPPAASTLVGLVGRCAERFGTRFVAAEHRADYVLRRVDGAIRLGDVRGASTGGGGGCVCWSGRRGQAPPDALPDRLNLAELQSLAAVDRGRDQGRLLLSCRGVCCRRAGRLALSNVSFDIHAGEILGLTGPNGAGKSTLLLLLAGGLKPTPSHCVRWHLPGRRTANPRVGLLLQNPLHQLFCETVREEVAVAAKNAGVVSAEYIDELLDAAALAGLQNRATLSLSYGEQQRTALAASMSARPPLILLDEPTHGMDASRLAGIIRFVLQARRTGTAFIVASHDLPLLDAFCDRVLKLQDGRLIE